LRRRGLQMTRSCEYRVKSLESMKPGIFVSWATLSFSIIQFIGQLITTIGEISYLNTSVERRACYLPKISAPHTKNNTFLNALRIDPQIRKWPDANTFQSSPMKFQALICMKIGD